MKALLGSIQEQWGSVEQCVVALGLIDKDGIQQLRCNMIVSDGGLQFDWKSHADLVAKAEDEAERRIEDVIAAGL
jgi:hypothetical protein